MLDRYFVERKTGEVREVLPDGTSRATVFMNDTDVDDEIYCRECGEVLGELTDENIDHQSEYHNCPC